MIVFGLLTLAIVFAFDVFLLWLIVSMLSGGNAAQEGKFFLAALVIPGGVLILGLIAYLADISIVPLLPLYFVVALLSMRFILRFPWPASAMVATVFVIIKLLLGLVCGE